MDENMYRQRIRSLEEHTDKLMAQIDNLRGDLEYRRNYAAAAFEQQRDMIAERDAEIAALRQQVAELEAWKDAVPVDAIAETLLRLEISASGNANRTEQWLKEICYWTDVD